jgi:hypothetical protein
MEARLAAEPGFADAYVRKRPPHTQAHSWLDSVASEMGAEKVFEHTHPGLYYLLVVFRRHAE